MAISIAKDAKVEQAVVCPLEEWEGSLVVPKYLSVDDVLLWYEGSVEADREKLKEDKRPLDLIIFESRSHMIKRWEIKGITSEHTAGDGRYLPDNRLLVWANTVTKELLSEARNPLVLRGKSSDTSDTEEMKQA